MAKRSRPKQGKPSAAPAEKRPVNAVRAPKVLPGEFRVTRGLQVLQALLIAGVVAWIYWPARHGTWLMDDNLYFVGNPLLREPDRLWKAWFEPASFVEYYPLGETVQWFQWQLWHENTFGYHVTNVVLHIVDSLLVWKLLGKFRFKLAWLGGLIFAVHPVQVESVAWIMELKNTLSLAPFLLSMCAWIDYEEHKRPRDYWLALGLFLVAMLCKISMAPFPVIILVYAWWRRSRIGWSDVKVSLPFFVISLILGTITILAGIWFREVYPQPGEIFPMGGLFSRIACAGLSLAFYFSICFLPFGLSMMYPRWSINPPSLIQFLPWLVLGGVIYVCWKNRQSWGRHVVLGLGFFGINLGPFLGFTQASYMIVSWVMDHFLYLPIVGLIGLIVAGLEHLKPQLPRPAQRIGLGVFVVLMILLARESRQDAATFKNMVTAWSNTVRCNPGSWLAHNDLGYSLGLVGRKAEAIEQLEIAIKLKPTDEKIHNNLGFLLAQMGRTSEAIEQYNEALRINPNYDNARFNLTQLMESLKNQPAKK